MGIGIFQLLIYCLGVFSLLEIKYVLFLFAFLSPFVLLGYIILYKTYKLNFSVNVQGESITLLDFLAIGIIVLQLIVNFRNVFMPPIEGDTLSIYLTYPKQYALLHKIDFMPLCWKNLTNWVPLNGFMIYTLAFLAKSETLALLFNWVFECMVVLSIVLIGNKIYSKLAGLISAAIFITTPMCGYLANSGKIDFQWFLFELLAIYSFIECIRDMKIRNFVVLGCFIAFAINIRPFSLISLAIFILIISLLVFYRNRCNLMIAVKYLFFSIGAILIPVALLSSHWFIKAWLVKGDFLYFAKAAGDFAENYNSFFDFFRLLWQLGFKGVLTSTSYAESFGFVILLFLPVAFFGFIKNLQMQWFIIFVVLYVTLWFGKMQATRFMGQIIVLVALGIGGAICIIIEKRKILGSTYASIILALSFTYFCLNTKQFYHANDLVLKQYSKEEFLEKHLAAITYLPSKPVTDFINNSTPSNAEIFIIGSCHPYYLDRLSYILTSDEASNANNILKLLSSRTNSCVPYVLVSARDRHYWRSSSYHLFDTFYSPNFVFNNFTQVFHTDKEMLLKYEPAVLGNRERDSIEVGVSFIAAELHSDYSCSVTPDGSRKIGRDVETGKALAYGPYLPFKAGRYKVSFFFQLLERTGTTNSILYIDVVEGSSNIIASSNIFEQNFTSTDKFQSFDLTVDFIKDMSRIENRAIYQGGSPIVLRKVLWQRAE